MFTHPKFSVLYIADDCRTTTQPLIDYLLSLQPVQLETKPSLPAELAHYDVVMVAHPARLDDDERTHLKSFVQAGGGCLGLPLLSTDPLPDFFGVQPQTVGPTVELRLLFTNPNQPIAARLPDAFYLPGTYHPLRLTDDNAETLLYADWRFEHSPMVTLRPVGEGLVACATPQAFGHKTYRQLLYRLLRRLAGQPITEQTLGVGLLGYPPSVGQLHGLGAQHTPGLDLRAVCDLSPKRRAAALEGLPDLSIYDGSTALAADDSVDLVIIATPPNSHAKLALQMLNAGKHVICEKPLALTSQETEAMLARADEQGLHLSCHQNRRWDLDYLAIEQAVDEGQIGDLFYLESFVGGFNHPCGYWHSHDAISGGTTYDWGAHYLDWVLRLMPGLPVEVICTRQNRLWHDITNADQERIQLRFANGQEADFVHSDVAAIRKPKWYLLGTEGAIAGYWRDITVHQIDPIHYFNSSDIPATEMPAELILRRRHASGQLIEQKLAVPQPPAYPFHRNLADHLLTGEQLVVPGSHSAQVVQVLEAAVRSAERGGAVEKLG